MYGEERRAYACRARIPEDFGAWQRRARPRLAELIGLERIAESAGHGGVSVQLDPDTEQLDGYTRGTAHLQTEPDVWVKFWTLKPDGTGPFPLAVTPHGHENGDEYAGVWDTVEAREKIERTDQDVAVQAARRGFLALAPATRGMGNNPSSYRIRDIAGKVGRDCRCHAWQVALAGRTLIGERVWDLMRLIDWARALPEVADGGVLMLGNSGGGMATLHAAACDERIGVALPCCAFNNYISPRGTMRHCPCKAYGGRREAVVALSQRHQIPVRGEHLDLVDLRGEAAEAPSRAVRGGRAGACHADVRQRGQVAERPPRRVHPRAEIAAGPAAAHPSPADGAVDVKTVRHPGQVDQHSGGVGHAVERMGGPHGPHAVRAVQFLPQIVHAPRAMQEARLEADIPRPIGHHGGELR